MGYIVGLMLMLCLFAFLLFILYYTIRSAIDDSETAKNIRELRKAMDKNYTDDCSDESEDENELDLEDNFQLLDAAYDECPACKQKISPRDNICPHCGISLGNSKE